MIRSDSLSKRRLLLLVCDTLADVHDHLGTKKMLASMTRQIDWSVRPADVAMPLCESVHFGLLAHWAAGGVGSVTAIVSPNEPARISVGFVSRTLSCPRIAESYVADILPEFVEVARVWGLAAQTAVRELAGRVGHLAINTAATANGATTMGNACLTLQP